MPGANSARELNPRPSEFDLDGDNPRMLPHELKIISFDDAQAVCTCGGWRFVATGRRDRRYIEAEFLKHAQLYK